MPSSTRVQHRKSIAIGRRFTPKFWSEVDGRFGAKKEIMRRYRQLIEDCGADSFQKKMICQRAVFLSIQLETMEREAADGERFDPGIYQQGVNALSGLLTKLGLGKKQKSPDDLKTYLKKRA